MDNLLNVKAASSPREDEQTGYHEGVSAKERG